MNDIEHRYLIDALARNIATLESVCKIMNSDTTQSELRLQAIKLAKVLGSLDNLILMATENLNQGKQK